MYSQCPECLTRFRVTAAALRAAQGTVRCGRCGSAFDALQRLTDTVPDDAESPPSSASSMRASTLAAFAAPRHTGGGRAESAADAGAVTEFHFSADDIEQVFVDARDWQKRFPPSTERAGEDAPTGGERSANDDGGGVPTAGAPVVVHEPEAIEDITLEGERIVIDGLPELDDDLREIVAGGATLRAEHADDAAARDDAVKLPGGEPPPVDLDATDQFEALRVTPEAVVAPAPEHVDASPRTEETVASSAAAAPAAPAPIVPFRLSPRRTGVTDALDDHEQAAAAEAGRGKTLAWGLGAVLLALALAAQLTHHYRQDLARDPNLGPAVRAAYARLGRPLAPNWDLAAFEVRQWGASEAAPAIEGAMTVRASLRNGAGFAQPLPLLRLELEDRFGGTVARRDFEPREYLNDPAQAARLLAPGAKTEAELDVVDAGTDAVGYRLDVCMRDDAGAVRCAQSSPGSAPR